MPDGGKLEEIYRLTKENNQILKGMRRSARLHTLFKFVLYGALIFGMFWTYVHYLAPLLLQMLDTLNKIQGVSSQAQGQIGQFTDTLEKIKSFVPGSLPTTH